MRGRIAEGLTPPVIIDFASAIGTYLDGGKIVVGNDTRISSGMVSSAVFSALMSCGCTVIDAGVVSAPELHFLVPALNADGGILIGAGHHPAEWNALVPLSRSGAYFNSVQMQELLDVYHGRRFSWQRYDKCGKIDVLPPGLSESYVELVCSQLNIPAISSGNFTVIADFCNGSGAHLASLFAEKFGIHLIPINDTLSGYLPHTPEPRPRSSLQVQSMLKVLKADVGFVFNTDMSRVAVVTDSCETLSEEYTFPLVVEHVLSCRAKEESCVVTNGCSTMTLDKIVEKYNGILSKVKVGQAHIIDRMQEVKAVIAGDGSGSIALGSSVPGFDGFMAMGLILESMALKNCGSAELAARLPRYHIIKRKVQCNSGHAYSLLRRMKGMFPDAVLTENDGFRFDWPDGWAHLRASETEPVIRIILEWNSLDGAEDKVLQITGQLERMVSI